MRESVKQLLVAVLLLVGAGVAANLYQTAQTVLVASPRATGLAAVGKMGESEIVPVGTLAEALLTDPDGRIVAAVGTTTISIELARTASARAAGLSGRASLAEDEGLLFIFPEPGRYGFWMKEMNFDLDLIWFDDTATVIGLTEGVSKDSYPQIFYPPAKIKYVLEVPTGWSGRHNLAPGDQLGLFN